MTKRTLASLWTVSRLAVLAASPALILVGCGGQVRQPETPVTPASTQTTGSVSSSSSSPQSTQGSASAPATGGRKAPKLIPPAPPPGPIQLTQRSQPRPEGVPLPFPGAEVTTNIVVGKQGGQFVWTRFGEGPKSFNSVSSNDSGSNDVVALMNTGLVTYDAQLQVYKPGLLEEYYPDPGDPTSWTLRLREGLRWSDGEPITSRDIVFATEAIYNEKIPCAIRDIMSIGGKPLKFEAVDERTVHLRLPTPSGSIISMLTFPPLAYHKYRAAYDQGPEQFVGSMSTDVPPAQIVSSGPFRLKQYVRGERVILERNPHYYRVDTQGTRLPYIDEFILAYSKDQDQMVLSFRKDGDAFDRPRAEALPRLIDGQEEGKWTVFDVGPANASSLFFFNLKEGISEKENKPHVDPDKLKWFRKKEFREAALLAIDRQSIINAELRGLAVPLHGLVPPAHQVWHNPNIPVRNFDPAKSKALLDSIGLVDADGDGIRDAAPGKPLTVKIITNKGNKVRESVGIMIANDLKKVGIGATLETVEWNALLGMTDETYVYEACLMGLVGGLAHAQGTMNTWPSFSRTNLHNPRQAEPSTPEEARIDELCRKFTTTADPVEQVKIFHEIQLIHAEQVLVLPLWVSNAYFVGRDRIGNWKPTAADDLVWNAAELFVKE